MPKIDYTHEPRRDILFIDVKSFYATVECVALGLDPLETMLVVMSSSDNTGNGLILAASPKTKEVLGVLNVTRADNVPNHPELHKVPPRMSYYIKKICKSSKFFVVLLQRKIY